MNRVNNINNNADVGIIEAVKKAREYLENITPVKGDCGLLCGSFCCQKRKPNPEDFGNFTKFGMWLFPYEDKLYENNPRFKIVHGKGNKSYPFLMCGGRCKREERPLFCRFFPYFPVVEPVKKSEREKKFKVKIIIHPTALNMCPLIFNPQYKLRVTSDFSRSVKKAVYVMLNQNCDELRKYLEETGDYLNSMMEFVHRIMNYKITGKG